MRFIKGFRWPSDDVIASAPRCKTGLIHKDVVREWLPLHPSQKWGDASDAMRVAVWEGDADAIKNVPAISGLNDDDWIYLNGRKAIHSALWEALCCIIVPRRWCDRGFSDLSTSDEELIKTLVSRRGSANKLLRGCLWVQSGRGVTWLEGSFRRSLTPISAVLELSKCPCFMPPWDYGDDVVDVNKYARAEACLRLLISLGAQPTPRDIARARRADERLRILIDQ